MKLSTRQEIEYFHLQFLFLLPTVLDAKLFVLKGGCNLRFFFSSIRYSEDIDLDVTTVRVGTLQKNIDKLLKSSALVFSLKTQQLEITEISKPKQTETTQRWKIQILSHLTGRQTHTKVEFSRRGIDKGCVIGRVNQAILDEYSLPRFSLPHYDQDRAFAQKINALINRTGPQARDVFDLDLLLSQKGKLPIGERLTPTQQKAATKVVLQMEYEDFVSKVVAYLRPEHQTTYEDQGLWNEIQLRLVEKIEKNEISYK